MSFLQKVWAKLLQLYYEATIRSWKNDSNMIIDSIFINGVPIIDLRNGGKLIIGKNVRLNSFNKGYHLNMFAPVKLFADRPGAVIEIGDNTRIHGSCIHAYSRISIGKNCLIAANCQIFDGSGHDLSFENVDNRIHTTGGARPITISDSVWIGANSIILPGVSIGRGTVVAAGSVVVKDLPPMVIAGGNPARVISRYNENGNCIEHD